MRILTRSEDAREVWEFSRQTTRWGEDPHEERDEAGALAKNENARDI